MKLRAGLRQVKSSSFGRNNLRLVDFVSPLVKCAIFRSNSTSQLKNVAELVRKLVDIGSKLDARRLAKFEQSVQRRKPEY